MKQVTRTLWFWAALVSIIGGGFIGNDRLLIAGLFMYLMSHIQVILDDINTIVNMQMKILMYSRHDALASDFIAEKLKDVEFVVDEEPETKSDNRPSH